jgi:hypothetical protein
MPLYPDEIPFNDPEPGEETEPAEEPEPRSIAVPEETTPPVQTTKARARRTQSKASAKPSSNGALYLLLISGSENYIELTEDELPEHAAKVLKEPDIYRIVKAQSLAPQITFKPVE